MVSLLLLCNFFLKILVSDHEKVFQLLILSKTELPVKEKTNYNEEEVPFLS